MFILLVFQLMMMTQICHNFQTNPCSFLTRGVSSFVVVEAFPQLNTHTLNTLFLHEEATKKTCNPNEISVANGAACIPSLKSAKIRLTISSNTILLDHSGTSLTSSATTVTANIMDPKFNNFYAGNESRLLYRFNVTIVKPANLTHVSSFTQNSTIYNLPTDLPLGVYTVSFEVIDSLYNVVNGFLIQDEWVNVISVDDIANNPKGRIGNMSPSEIHKVTLDLNSIPNSKKEQVIDAIAETLQNLATLSANDGLQMVKSLQLVTNASNANYVSKDSRNRIAETISRYSTSLVTFVNDSSIVSSQTFLPLVTDLISVASNIVNLVKLFKNDPSKKESLVAVQNSVSLIALLNDPSNIVKIESENYFVMVLDANHPSLKDSSSPTLIMNESSNYTLTLPLTPLISKNMGNVSFGLIKYENDLVASWRDVLSINENHSDNNSDGNFKSITYAASPIVQFRPLLNGYYYPVNGLTQRFNLTFHVNDLLFMNQTELDSFLNMEDTTIRRNITKRYKCYYWNETLSQWLSNGCETYPTNVENQIICSCDHTTRFSAFVEFSLQNSQFNDWNEIAITTIVIDSLFLIVISLLVILLIVKRKSQPVKSRYITPYLALSALFVESLMSGVLSKSLLLRYYQDNPSSMVISISNHISSMISTSLYATAVWCYMIMSFRYLIHRYFYEWMMKAFEYNKKDSLIKYLCILKRQSLLVISSLLFGLCIAFYFSIFVILRGVKVFSDTQFTQATSISLFVIMLIMTCLIIAIYVADIYLDFTNKQIRDELVDISEEMIQIEKEQQLQQQQTNLIQVNFSQCFSSSQLSSQCFSTQIDKSKTTGKNSLVNLLFSRIRRQPPPLALKKVIELFSVNDKLMFRAEVIFFLLGMFCFIVSYGIGFSTIDLRFSQTLNDSNDIYYHSKLTSLLDGIGFLFEVFMTWFFIAAFGGFAWLWSLIIQIRQWKYKQQTMNSSTYGQNNVLTREEINLLSEKYEIYKLLKNQYLLTIFRQYCKLEMSLENYIIWMKIENTRKNFGDLWQDPETTPPHMTIATTQQEVTSTITTSTSSTASNSSETLKATTETTLNDAQEKEFIHLSLHDFERWKQLISELTQWYHVHIQDHAEMGINLSGGAKRKFVGILQLLETSFHTVTPTATMMTSERMLFEKKTFLALKEDLASALESVMSDVIYNLLDTYARFNVSEEYKVVKEIATQKERISLEIFK